MGIVVYTTEFRVRSTTLHIHCESATRKLPQVVFGMRADQQPPDAGQTPDSAFPCVLIGETWV